MIHVLTWCWGDKYGDHYVRRLEAGVRRNLKQRHRFLCVTDRGRHVPDIVQVPIVDRDLLEVPGCLARLRLFDPQWQVRIGISAGERIVNIDLDAVVTGSLDPLFDRDEPFSILQGINTTNPCPMNGSLWMLRAGYRPDVWDDFDLDTIGKLQFHAFPDDQGWFGHMMPDAGAWGPRDGVYGYKKLGWPVGDDLPDNARLVAFPGWRDPSKIEGKAWVRQHWA